MNKSKVTNSGSRHDTAARGKGVRLASTSLACALLAAAGAAHAAGAQDGKFTLNNLLGGLKSALSKTEASTQTSTPAPAPDAKTGNAAAQDSDAALSNYTKLIQELEARNELPEHQWQHTYLLDRPTIQAYTTSSIPGMYSLRNVRPDDPAEAQRWAKNMGILFEWQPIVLFSADGNMFYAHKDNFGKGSASWIVYDKNAGGFKTGEATRPYIQDMLVKMDTTGLPLVGKAKPTFILYTSPSCPYSLRVEPLLEKSGMSYRIFPTFTINPRGDMPEVHRIFCSDDKIGTWKKALARKSPEMSTAQNRDGSWWCSPTIMPVLTLRDLDFIFGQGYPTPSYYFPDGTVITGADKLQAVRAKSKEMEAKNLYFN